MDIDLLLHHVQRKWWPLCTPCSPQDNMFNLMSNFCTWFSKIQEPIRRVTVLVVGLDKAGKTSTIRSMSRVPHSMEGGSTQGCMRSELRVENYLVTLLDVGGSVESQGAWREYYGEAHGVIFVVDSSDRPRIKEVKEVLADLLKQPRVAGKPILVLANKQDKMNALLGSELIEMLSLEKLVNQSRSVCHIEPCSALMDLRRWSDRKALRGLRWLLRAVCLDYPGLCIRVAQDSKRPLEPRERNSKAEKTRGRNKSERMRTSKSGLSQVHRPKDMENISNGERKLQPIQNIMQKENTLKKKLKKTTRRKKKPAKASKDKQDEQAASEKEEEEASKDETENRTRSPLIPPNKGKHTQKGKVKEKTWDVPESPHDNEKPLRAMGKKRKRKKGVKVKRRNKINTEGTSGASAQSVDLSNTFDLYRKAILALKERQDQGQ